MKISRYNKILNTEDNKKIAFNSMSCALAEVDESFFDIYNNIDKLVYEDLDAKTKDLVDNMLEGGYIIQDSSDELKMIKYKHLTSKFNSNTLGLTIAPTLDCNFACPYCYETPKKGFMSEEVQNSIIDMIEKRVKKVNAISVSWYGGEPLLGKDIVLSLSDRIVNICNENNIEYSAFMITNGFLLNEELIDKLKKLKVTGYQITIDGPPRIHNERRRLRGEKRDTFNKLIENIKILKAKNLDVNIRVNVDSTNIEYIDELLDILKENELNDLIFHFGHVKTDYSDVCNSIKATCLNDREYADFDFECRKKLLDKGFTNESMEYYPSLKSNYCGADCVSSYVIDAEGYMYKCWTDVGKEEYSIGNVISFGENGQDEKSWMNNINYLLWSPFEFKECRECWLLPICMGGCPGNGMKNDNKPKCGKWKYTIEKSLISKYKSCNKECK